MKFILTILVFILIVTNCNDGKNFKKIKDETKILTVVSTTKESPHLHILKDKNKNLYLKQTKLPLKQGKTFTFKVSFWENEYKKREMILDSIIVKGEKIPFEENEFVNEN